MSEQDLPKDSAPLSPWEYWRESFQAWTDFSQRASEIVMNQSGGPQLKRGDTLKPDAETLASELLRTFSDLNLRHWQNTARLLESMPSWMHLPNTMTGSALVDWFDNFQRMSRKTSQTGGAVASSSEANLNPPKTLNAPKGKADDLTRIKGIGPKLSARLNDLGIYHFKQIAGWSDSEAKWVDDFLSFKGRVGRENWVTQARVLTANGSATVH